MALHTEISHLRRKRSASAGPEPDARKTVLVVEDNVLNRELTNALLKTAGYNVVLAKDGAEALMLLGRERVDLLMLDIDLPFIDGHKVLEALHEQGIHVPAIFVSGLPGEEPEVIEYLKTPPSREKLVELIAAMKMAPRDLLREKGTPYAELDLGDPKWTDDELIDFMLKHPILINRPIVVTPLGAVLARPTEAVLSILPNPDIGPVTKEDGEVVIDAEGKRVV
jgi:arsenate reductase